MDCMADMVDTDQVINFLKINSNKFINKNIQASEDQVDMEIAMEDTEAVMEDMAAAMEVMAEAHITKNK